MSVAQMVKKERIAWIDTAKCICIFMVLFSHMEYVPVFLQCIIKPFFLTTFFFLTGYVFNSNRPFKKFILNRIKTLLVPAILFSMLYLLDFKSILQGSYSAQVLLSDLSVLFRQQRGQGDMLWFLYVSFLAEIPLFFLTKYVKDKRIVFSVSFVLCELSIIYVKHFMTVVPYWYLHVIFVAMFIMVLGNLFKENEHLFEKFSDNTYIIFGCIFVYLITVFILHYRFNTFVNINDYASNQIIWFFTVILGIFICISLAKKMPANKAVLYCGRNTLIFYLLHDRVRGVINAVLQKTPIWSIIFKNELARFVTSVVVCCAEIVLLMCLSEFIIRFVPFIVGRKYQRGKKSAQND